MPPKSRKRKSPSAPKNKHEQAPPLAGVPDNVQQTIQGILQDVENSNVDKSLDKQVTALLNRLEKDLDLSHVNPDAVRHVLTSSSTPKAFERLIGDLYRQTQRAHRVFELLDPAEKGVVVVEDLQRATQELDQNLQLDDLEEMMNQYAQDGLLTKDDLVKIARQVGL